MKKYLIACIVVLIMVCGSGCDNKVNNESIVGSWTASGVIYEDEIYSFKDVPELAELYDLEYLTIESNGKFSQLTHIWAVDGEWEPFSVEGYEETYILHRKHIRKVGDKKTEKVDGDKIAFILESDSNVLVVSDCEGDSKIALLYLKDGETSTLIDN